MPYKTEEEIHGIHRIRSIECFILFLVSVGIALIASSNMVTPYGIVRLGVGIVMVGSGLFIVARYLMGLVKPNSRTEDEATVQPDQ